MSKTGFGLLCAVLLVGPALRGQSAEQYIRAVVNKAGQLQIETAAGQTIMIDPSEEQVGFDKVAIAPDGLSVGWVGLRENCCTSYPIPTRLTVYVQGTRHTFEGEGLPVWTWKFLDAGRQVAFHQETVHGGLGNHCELHDVATGRLIAEWSPTIDPSGRALPKQSPPKWVTKLVGDRVW